MPLYMGERVDGETWTRQWEDAESGHRVTVWDGGGSLTVRLTISGVRSYWREPDARVMRRWVDALLTELGPRGRKRRGARIQQTSTVRYVTYIYPLNGSC